MAHEILSVKMYELDKKLEQTHSRIQLAESMDTERLHQQIQNLWQECQESRITLENRLRHSKTDCVMKLAGVYDQVEAAVGKVLEAEKFERAWGADIGEYTSRSGGKNPHCRIRP